jgi:hypothetical protein
VRAALIQELADRVAALRERDVLTVVELAKAGVITWRIARDSNGTPRCWRWPPKPWLALEDNGGLNVPMLREIALSAEGVPMLLVRSAVDGPRASRAFAALEADVPIASIFTCTESLEKLLGEVLADDRLTQFYELVVIRRSRSGRPELGGQQLFPPGAKRGETQQVSVRCEPGDDLATAFAVVAVAPVRRFRLVSVRTVRVAPGSYTITAELRRPGVVSFDGLGDASFSREDRSWSELVASLPVRIEPPRSGHLICMVETSGSNEQVEERLYRVGQLMRLVPGAAARQSVSLICYGPHAVGRDYPEEPVRVLAWARTSKEALAEVDKLSERGAAKTGYARAAQLECALDQVVKKLLPKEERCVLVTVGARPAFPPGRDLVSGLIPCPQRNDWRTVLKRLGQSQDCSFGAILDDKSTDEIWAQLGRDALVYGSPVDVPSFARRLGLLNSATAHIPFPLDELLGA